MKNQNKVNPAVWNVPMSYLRYARPNGSDDQACKILRRIPIVGTPQRKILTLDTEGAQSIWTHGKDGEYWLNGKTLTSALITLAAIGKSKVKIY